MQLRSRLVEAVKKHLAEERESSAEMIKNNTAAPACDANVNPGEFKPGEITDKENLENTATLANDTDFENKEAETQAPEIADIAVEISALDISVPEETVKEEKKNPFSESKSGWYIIDYDEGVADGPYATEEEAHSCNAHEEGMMSIEYHEKNPVERDINAYFGESRLRAAVKHLLEKKNLAESDYAAPLDFVPDVRINVSDVLNGLQQELGLDAAGINVVKELDSNKNDVYKVTQFDKEKLPKKLTVCNVELSLDDNIYSPNAISKEFPIAK